MQIPLGPALFQWRSCVCLLLVAILPASLAAENSGTAILRASGAVLLNKVVAAPSSALFPGDVIETQAQASARIAVSGSTVEINPETVLEFEGDEIFLEHGSVLVSTSSGFRVRVRCVVVTPAERGWTQYTVTEAGGRVTVAAQKKDVNIDSGSSDPQQAKRRAKSERVSVQEGHHESREEKCDGAIARPTTVAGAKIGILNSTPGRVAGLGAIGLTCLLLCRGDDPVSPDAP